MTCLKKESFPEYFPKEKISSPGNLLVPMLNYFLSQWIYISTSDLPQFQSIVCFNEMIPFLCYWILVWSLCGLNDNEGEMLGKEKREKKAVCTYISSLLHSVNSFATGFRATGFESWWLRLTNRCDCCLSYGFLSRNDLGRNVLRASFSAVRKMAFLTMEERIWVFLL